VAETTEPSEVLEPDAPPVVDPNLAPTPGSELLDDLSETLAAFNALRKSDEAAADRILDGLGGSGPVEQEMVRQLALPRPLFRPDRFEQAHRLTMKSMEVLKRNGARQPKLPKGLGPLRPLAAWVVQLFTRFIVQNHISNLIENLRHLYGRREAWALPGSEESAMLRRARFQAERLAPGYKGKALGLPGFLVGGAVISSALGAMRNAGETVTHNRALVAVTTLLLLLLLLGGAWCVLRAGAVARKRIRLTTERPMKALYETIGACGRPPRDQALQFALFGLVGMAVAWIVIPAGLIFVFH
jgi:hypothetical protein